MMKMGHVTAGNPMTPAPASKIQKLTPFSSPYGSAASKEKILVTVRLRPLNPKEQAAYDLIAWECADDQTIISRNLNHERPSGSYTFDRVFDSADSTDKVYEDGARDVTLSALKGINATIFAYGQTGSGKTFTMSGITENAIKDIYEHIDNTPGREFVIRFSALEIYNEAVVDLLNRGSGSLRLLYHPEKGTFVVDKLTEIDVKDIHHLRQLISVCEAQRQVGETALNDKSSRSHQIIRLTIESSLSEKSGSVKSFLASLNLVDLAGSERASQTKSNGARLKEGSHINRSLLTLTTVIRKLSGGQRNNHIPYRDSNLTRILQHSLGGNARTAIICTMSPALSHVEQSRNTLSFATSAKEVTNNARVNMVVEQKQLVNHLQKEVARLEAELQTPKRLSSSSCLRTLIIEKDLKIQEMEKEISELKGQLKMSRTKTNDEHHVLPKKRLSFSGKKTVRESANASILVHEIRKLELLQRQLGEEANQALEVLQTEFALNKNGSRDATNTIAKLLAEIKEMKVMVPPDEEEMDIDKTRNLKEEITRLNQQGRNIVSLEAKLENVQRSIDKLVGCLPEETLQNSKNATNPLKKKKILPFSLSNTPSLLLSPCSPSSSTRQTANSGIENQSPVINKADDAAAATPMKNANQTSGNSVNVKKIEKMFKRATEENIRSIKSYVTGLKERVAKLQYQKQLLVLQVLEMETNEDEEDDESNKTDQCSSPSMSVVQLQPSFEDQRRQIIMLWHLCHVSLIHRTQFYLLFRGDNDDQIYLEVELRRLTWLEHQLAEVGNASPALLSDEPATSVSSSIKALKQEREYLAKKVSSKLTMEEREMIYLKWEVPMEGKQRRRMQLVNKLWTDPLNMKHVKESAEVVAKLVGFCESGERVSKEMFELNFVNHGDRKTWMGWNLISNFLHL
ncbi:kinesin-like protein NACK2 [Impatiens glandulifera]|uniref:kinesin-like protein NACK2 n=1 Tax=Impatiens glandulifera TaxID=253017 RepID=UPI001FB0D401|nr:kinesin-like protein NACK2 [Impatiens glandulifera]